MERRTFIKSELLSFLAAINPFRAEGNKLSVENASLVEGGIVFDSDWDKEVISTYCAPKGVIIWGNQQEGTPGCLFQDLTLSVTVPKDGKSGRTTVEGMLMRVLGPSPIMKAAYEQFGDVMKAESNTMKFGLVKEDKTTLWFTVPKTVLTCIGMSVSAGVFSPAPNKNGDVFKARFPGDTGEMIITEHVQFVGAGEPAVCDEFGKTPDELLVHRQVSTRRDLFRWGK